MELDYPHSLKNLDDPAQYGRSGCSWYTVAFRLKISFCMETLLAVKEVVSSAFNRGL